MAAGQGGAGPHVNTTQAPAAQRYRWDRGRLVHIDDLHRVGDPSFPRAAQAIFLVLGQVDGLGPLAHLIARTWNPPHLCNLWTVSMGRSTLHALVWTLVLLGTTLAQPQPSTVQLCNGCSTRCINGVCSSECSTDGPVFDVFVGNTTTRKCFQVRGEGVRGDFFSAIAVPSTVKGNWFFVGLNNTACAGGANNSAVTVRATPDTGASHDVLQAITPMAAGGCRVRGARLRPLFMLFRLRVAG